MEIRVLKTQEELDRAATLAYDVYVREKERLCERADHDAGTLRLAELNRARVIGAFHSGALIGTISALCWQDAPFPAHYRDIFQLDRFAEVTTHERMALVTRPLIRSDWRHGTVTLRLLGAAWSALSSHGVQLVFGACQPHLLPLYRKLGMRTFGGLRDHAGQGAVVPFVATPADHSYLRQTKSVGLALVSPDSEDRALAARLRDALADDDPVLTADTDPDAYWGAIKSLLDERPPASLNPFAGLSTTELRTALGHAYVLACTRGTKLIDSGQTARTVFIVLDGVLGLGDGDRVRRLGPGEICGMPDNRRSTRVQVMSRTARLLCISTTVMRALSEQPPASMVRFFANLSRMPAAPALRAHRSQIATRPRSTAMDLA